MTVDVLVVGAGPTGLSMAAYLAAYGVTVRVVDRSFERVNESRALAIQPRTLEVLDQLGVTDRLVDRGNPGVRLRLHARGREVSVPLFDLGLADTAYPYLLFLSQAETERVLEEHLNEAGLSVERGKTLVELRPTTELVTAVLRTADGTDETVSAKYVVGCDGASSAVREFSDIPFEGSTYPQTFVLADLDADGIETDAAHVYLSPAGMLFFFPLLRPATWRLLAMRPANRPALGESPTLTEVEQLSDAYGASSVRLHDPVWATNFRLHHRAAAQYRRGRVFLAGDAAHIHSPAGAQGMNTGIQDAANLAWKLAYVINGISPAALLDTYDAERAPVGRVVLRFTDRAFRIATSTNPLLGLARTRVAPTALQLAMRFAPGRKYAFRTVAQLAIRYRSSPLSKDGPGARRRTPHAGDRLPDGPVTLDGSAGRLQKIAVGPRWTRLLCGSASAWPQAAAPTALSTAAVITRRLSTDHHPGVLHDPGGVVTARLGLAPSDTAHLLVRPDGHIAYRASGSDLAGLTSHLRRWTTALN